MTIDQDKLGELRPVRRRPGPTGAAGTGTGPGTASPSWSSRLTTAFLKELQAACTGEPRFRNQDVGRAQTY